MRYTSEEKNLENVRNNGRQMNKKNKWVLSTLSVFVRSSFFLLLPDEDTKCWKHSFIFLIVCRPLVSTFSKFFSSLIFLHFVFRFVAGSLTLQTYFYFAVDFGRFQQVWSHRPHHGGWADRCWPRASQAVGRCSGAPVRWDGTRWKVILSHVCFCLVTNGSVIFGIISNIFIVMITEM